MENLNFDTWIASSGIFSHKNEICDKKRREVCCPLPLQIVFFFSYLAWIKKKNGHMNIGK